MTFVRLVAIELIETLLHPENRYGLSAGEVLLLEQQLKEARGGRWPRPEDLPDDVIREGGVILDSRPELDNPLSPLSRFDKPRQTPDEKS